MAEFPSSLERTVASALLLLSTTPPPLSKVVSENEYSFEEKIEDECSFWHKIEEEYSFEKKTRGECSFKKKIEGKSSKVIQTYGDSNSCSSVLTGDESSETQALGTAISSSAYRNELMLNVVRKSRSKLVRISENWNINYGEEIARSTGSASSESSSLSSSSSVATSAPSRCQVNRAEKKLAVIRQVWSKKHAATAHMRRRAEAILSYLSTGCSSEVKIRQVLGDSPDTSKALRMLLKLEEIKRSGTGGRQDPYIYMIA